MKKRKNFIKEKHLLSKLSETWITEQNTPFFFFLLFINLWTLTGKITYVKKSVIFQMIE